VLLIAGGSLYLTELSGRITILGSYNVDALRNLALIGLASLGTLVMILQSQGRIPNFLRIWPYLLFAVWGTFSLLWSIDLEYSLRELPKLFYPILVYLITAKALHAGTSDRKLLEHVRNVMAFFAIISLMASMSTLVLLISEGRWIWGESRLLNIPLQFPSLVSASYIILEVAAWGAIPGWRPRKWLAAFLFLDVVLSLTRTHIFALLVALFAVWGALGRSWLRLFGGFIVGFTIVVTLLVVDNPVKERMFWRPQQITLSWLLDKALTDPGELLSGDHIRFSGRIGYWEHVLAESRAQRPALVGSGLGSSRPLIMNFERNPALVAHSDVVSYLAELGYIGLTMFVFMWSGALVIGLRGAFRRNISPVRRAAAIVLVGLVILNVVVSIAYNPSVQIFIFHSLAMVMLAILFRRKNPSHLRDAPQPSRPEPFIAST
jgi:hypothetical protein